MLETIREYAAERLAESGEADELRRRHAGHFLAFGREAEPDVGKEPTGWLDRLELEHDNLRAALDRLETSGEGQAVLLIVSALTDFWEIRGHLTEGARRFERALAADERPTAARAKALNGAGELAAATGDLTTARLRAIEALSLHREMEDAWGAAEAHRLLGVVAAEGGDWEGARRHSEESLRGFQQVGDERRVLEATRVLAWASYGLGALDDARALYEGNLSRARALRDGSMVAVMLGTLTTLFAVPEGRFEDAASMLSESIRILHDLGDRREIMNDLCRVADALASAGKAEAAARIISSAEALREEIGGMEGWVENTRERALTTIRSQLDEAAFAEAWEQGRALTADEAVALALDSLD